MTRALLGILLTCASAAVAADGDTTAAVAAARQIDMVASRFRFEPALIEAVEGERVVIRLRSADVEHGFGIDAVKVDVDIPAGGAVVIAEFVAPAPGTYLFECTEFCGRGHQDMQGKLLVHPRGTVIGSGGTGARPARVVGEVDLAEPDFTVINLPTTLRLPRHKSAFRVTHRFGRPLGDGDLGDLAADAFGLDSGAQVGLEVRFGLMQNTQLMFHRTSDRTIQIYAQQHLMAQTDGRPLSLAALASVEGLDNFSEEYSPAIGVIASRRLGERGAIYVVPAYVASTRPEGAAAADSDGTFILGLSARLRLSGKTSLLAEASPRVAGYKPGKALVSFGIENRVGGHSFQFNFSNGFGTTLAQVARGGPERRDWFLGFNISRKFF